MQMLREALLLRAMMVPTQSTVAAKVIAEESKADGGLNQILISRVNKVLVDSGDTVHSGTDARVQRAEMNSAEEAEDARMAMRATKQSGDVVEQSEDVDSNDELSWEEKDIMRGLGIHNLQHVSSSVPVKEMVSRAAAKVCQVLVDIGDLRTKEGRPFRAEVDHLSKMAMNAVLDPRNEDCFKKSESFSQ